MPTSLYKALLFDLDGTLLDTAPDLAATLNILLERHQYPTLPLATIRPVASYGSKALIQLGFKIDENDSRFSQLRQEFMETYSQHSCVETELFPGMLEVLIFLEQQQIPWGIVTNKPGWLTMPLLEHLGLLTKPSCIVCGDTLSVCKPDPAPVLYACELLNLNPVDCLYIGDAKIDVIAGKGAGVKTLLALYGYLSENDQHETWSADGFIDKPLDLIKVLNSSLHKSINPI